MAFTPAQIVDKQLDAYNSQNLDLFCSYFSSKIEITTLGKSREPTSGLSQLRAMYSDLFKKFPNNRCKILNRIENGSYVIDQELISGREPEKTNYTVVATYFVEDGKIQKVWFFAEKD